MAHAGVLPRASVLARQERPGFAAWTGTGDYMAFIVVGWILSAYVSAVMWGMGFSLKTEMDQGVLESNWVAPITPARLLVGRTLASVAMGWGSCWPGSYCAYEMPTR